MQISIKTILKISAKKRIFISVLWIVFLCILTLLLNLYWNPRYKHNRFSPDRSVFSYAGKLVNDGELPYRDFWDHKPPAIYYINAIGIRLMGTSSWTFWWMNVIWIAISANLLFIILRKLTNTFSAVVASGVFLVTLMYPSFFSGGNTTEIYGILPQILIIGASYLLYSTGQKRWAFASGFFTAVAFLFKQTCIGIGIGAALAILFLGFKLHQQRKMIARLGLFVIGGTLPLGLIALIWIIPGAFSYLWDAVFLYNFVYLNTNVSAASIFGLFDKLLVEFPFMPVTIAVLVALIAYLVNNRYWLFFSKSTPNDKSEFIFTKENKGKQWAFLVIFMALPFELAFVVIGGRNYEHYYSTLLPAFVSAIAYLCKQLNLTNGAIYINNRIKIIACVLFTMLAAAWLINAVNAEKPEVGLRISLSKPLYGNFHQDDPVSEYILSNSSPDDPILIWGNNIGLYLETNRRNPTRYLYPQPLFLPCNCVESRFDEFLRDLEKDPPIIIVGLNIHIADIPSMINVPDNQLCVGCIQEAADGMRRLKAFVQENYILESSLNIYKLRQ